MRGIPVRLLLLMTACAPPPAEVGALVLDVRSDGTAHVQARFGRIDADAILDGRLPECAVARVQNCTLVSCPSALSGDRLMDAGELTATVGALPAQTIAALSPGLYSAALDPAASAGQFVDIEALGATFPAFTTRLTPPSAPTTTLPTTATRLEVLAVPATSAQDADSTEVWIQMPTATGYQRLSCDMQQGQALFQPFFLQRIEAGRGTIAAVAVVDDVAEAGTRSVRTRATTLVSQAFTLTE
jgi:hypothetical protein